MKKNLKRHDDGNEGLYFSINNIPKEVMEQILLRVPSKDLATSAKYVSKTWFSLITRRSFVFSKLRSEWPLTLSLNSTCCSSPQLVHTLVNPDHSLTFSLYQPLELLNDNHNLQWKTTQLYTTKICLNMVDDLQYFEGAYCIHGLISFHTSCRSVYICNPLTGEFVSAPKITYCEKKDRMHVEATGFGFCVLQNKYKFVHIFSYKETTNNLTSKNLRAEVLTIGHDTSWRSVECPHHPFFPDGKALVIDNLMYWTTDVVLTTPKKLRNPLVTFDINTDEFGEILITIPSLYGNISLIQMEGKLCIIQVLFDEDEIVFWVPKDITEGSWIIKYKCECGNSFIEEQFNDEFQEFIPLVIIAKYIYVLQLDEYGMLYYDLPGKLLGYYLFSDSIESQRLYAVSYVSSLVSISSR